MKYIPLIIMFAFLNIIIIIGGANTETKKTTDYQIVINNDTIAVYDGERYVGNAIDTAWNSPLMDLIMEDNN